MPFFGFFAGILGLRKPKPFYRLKESLLCMQIVSLDLHSHRNEKNVSAEEYFSRVKEVGLNAIAITEHADIGPKTAFEILEAGKPEDLVLIPASELNCEYGHLLCYSKSPELFELSDLFVKDVKFETCLDIAKQNGLLLSISHPWGFNSDSFGFTLGFERLEELVRKNDVGVEIYNGMIGNLSNFIFQTGWVKKPISFFEFLEQNRVARKAGLARLGSKLKNKIENQRREMVERCSRAIELAQYARFVTAGSDAHSASRIGEGIMKLKTSVPRLTNENVLDEIRKKENIIWSGPLVVEKENGIFERADKPFKNSEILQGMRYATGSLVRKVRENATRRKKKMKEN